MQQLGVNSSAMLIDEICVTLDRVVTGFNARIEALEADTGLTIFHGIDEDRTYPEGALASIGGAGLMIHEAGKWRPVVNGIKAVRFEGETFVVERSDGTVQRSPIKKAQAKPGKVAA